MKLEHIRREVENLVDDPSFDSETIDQYINQALEYVASQINLPTLKGLGVVSTELNQAYTDMSVISGNNFSGILRLVVREDGKFPTIYADLESLILEYPTLDQEGNIEAVALDGNTLWYQKIPTTETPLTVVYFRDPAPLVKDSDIPSDTPSHLHRHLYVHGAAYLIYDQIEDGIDGEKVNTANHRWQSFDENNKLSGITKLREWLGKRRVHHISSVWSA